MRNSRSPSLMFAVKTAMAALLTIIIGCTWALIVNSSILASTPPQPAAAGQPFLITPYPQPVVVHQTPAEIVYTVRPGDTLWSISADVYHNPSDWGRLYAMNREIIGGNPNMIHPGETLKIQAASS